MAAEVNEKEKHRKKMKVFVAVPRPLWHDPRHGPIALEVSSDDTVASVKATLHKTEGILPCLQRLVFVRSALPDDDDTTLADHGVVDSSTFHLVETKMQVFVRCMDIGACRTIMLADIESSDTVENFRLRLQEREDIGLRPAQQRLRYNAKQFEDGHTLADYGVSNCSTIELIFRPGRRLRRRVVELDIDVTDTVGRIKERVEEAKGVPVACQSVFNRGEELDNGRALAHYGILEWLVMEIEVTGPGKKIKQKTLPEIPAVQRRRFCVHLVGPELEAICASSCDTDPAY
ncbi:unnamed protein product [Alopecurus aequalis]